MINKPGYSGFFYLLLYLEKLFLNRQDAKNAKKNIRLENMICTPFRLAQYQTQLADFLGDLGVLGGSTEFFRLNQLPAESC